MELYHNQVTRIQGPASLRFHHRSFGLYFIAANIDADVTILDFPSRERFVREIRKEYDIIGISFITPNFLKAREMARLIRLHSPGSVIVLGGHGAAIEGVEKLIDCDHVVRGEGIRWMRRVPRPGPRCADRRTRSCRAASTEHLRHPDSRRRRRASSCPASGCVNGCNFCCTTHFFEKAYVSFLRTGQGGFRAMLPDRRRAGHARVLHHGREFPEGPRPRAGTAGA